MTLSQGFVRWSLGGSLLLLTACGGGGSDPDPVPPQATIDIQTSTAASPLSANAGDAVNATATVSNAGTAAVTTAFETRIYLSVDGTIDADDALIGSATVAALDAGASTDVTASYTLPANLRSGTYYIGALADTGAVIDESDETNNGSQVALEVAGGTCSADDYEEDDTSADATALPMNTPQRHDHCDDAADWMVFSAIAGTAYSLTTSELGGSADTRIEVYDTEGTVLLATSGDALEPGASRLAWTAPSDGDYYLKVVADAGLSGTGPDTGYTVLLGEATSDIGIIDAAIDAAALAAGGTASASLTLFNEGFTPTGSFVVKAYLSADGTIDAQDTLVGTFAPPDIPAGQTTQLSGLDIAIPKETAEGDYSLLFMADADNSVAEFNEGNNVSSAVPVTVTAAACTLDAWEDDDSPQYASALAYGTAQSHNFCDDQQDWLAFDALEGQAYLFEIGAGASGVSTTVYDGAESIVDGWDVAANTTASNTFLAPATGTYYLLATTTAGGAGSDYSVTAYDSLPDLLPGTLASDGGAVLGGILNVSVTTRNDGLGDAAASDTAIYLSTDVTIDQGDLLLGSVPVPALVAGATQDTTVSLPVPDTLSEGAYYIGAVTDTGGQVTEVNETNNATATPDAITVSAPPCAVDANEQNDFIADATAVPLAQDVSLNYCDDAYDWLQVDLTQNTGTGYLLSAAGTSASTSFDIYGADKTTVLLRDAGNQVHWEPPATGTYYVLAKEGTGTAGLDTDYTLNVTQCDKDEFEPDDTADTAPLIMEPAQPQNRNFCDDGYDMAAFEPYPDVTYTIQVTGPTIKPTISITDGTEVVASGSGYVMWTAPSTPAWTYYIVIEGTQAADSGYVLDFSSY